MVKTPGDSIRAFCVQCCGGIFSEVSTCDGTKCSFHKYRLGRGRPSVKLIRKFCLECMGGSRLFVNECSTTDCPIYPYRFGKRVNISDVSRKRSSELINRIPQTISRRRTEEPVTISRKRTITNDN